MLFLRRITEEDQTNLVISMTGLFRRALVNCLLCKRVISDFKSELSQEEIYFGISLSNTTVAQSKCCGTDT